MTNYRALMKALPAPEPENKPAIQPTEVWSPSMGTEVMPVAGEIALRAEGLRCNCCGELNCPYEPLFRNDPRYGPERGSYGGIPRDGYRGAEYRYVAVDEMRGPSALDAELLAEMQRTLNRVLRDRVPRRLYVDICPECGANDVPDCGTCKGSGLVPSTRL